MHAPFRALHKIKKFIRFSSPGFVRKVTDRYCATCRCHPNSAAAVEAQKLHAGAILSGQSKCRDQHTVTSLDPLLSGAQLCHAVLCCYGTQSQQEAKKSYRLLCRLLCSVLDGA